MEFIDRHNEFERLDRLLERETGLAVVYGRRRVGKTRLLLEWSKRHNGLYSVADQSAADFQRRYFAEAASEHFPGFADVEYPDWWILLKRLAREAEEAEFRGPIIFDELPYLVLSSEELPSVLQRWIDHDAKQAGLVIAFAGSSQRMMHGTVLDYSAPLFGRAHEIMRLRPIEISHWATLLPGSTPHNLIDAYTAWGGIPRYWELADEAGPHLRTRIHDLVLDPLGPLHQEPDRILAEEIPSAAEVRPVLDAIGAGAHRISEIGGRLGRPATSITRPVQRLIEMDLVQRDVPFGESEKKSKRSLYKISDPFFRLWFDVVAPHRGQLAAGTRESRLQILDSAWPRLASQAWEELCRHRLPRVDTVEGGPWGPASRWWRGNAPEWDLVSESLDGERLLLGEVKWTEKRPTTRDVERWAAALERREPPTLPKKYAKMEQVRCLFVPQLPESRADIGGIQMVSADQLIAERKL